jgi:hypothetical protein
VRLRNVSQAAVCAPLRVEVTALNPPRPTDPARRIPVEILNATNGKPGAGAVFDYSAALGPGGCLDPGAVSGSLVWRLSFAADDPRPDMSLKVIGRVAR